jgi:hypothetical protein
MLAGFLKVEDPRLNMEASPTSQPENQWVLQRHQLYQVNVFRAQETEGSLPQQHLHLNRISQPLLFIK